ncbi:YhdH/YhfP family quinone oxidoreductase [Persicobacter diffluens]|uniref:Alcohol dehydrogenase n=1 Tax=Persicobacter diffluens TaxID=981 RepID=A0AAN4W0W2_9BACT|nr:alcohol dehydrogenase [Persicobacter diffluens]
MGQNNQTFKAFRVEEQDGAFKTSIQQMPFQELAEGEILVKVHYSSLNFKDALSASGNKGVTRNFPHTPGIDAVGIVEQSNAEAVAVGAEVIVTSYDLGMNTDGGFAEYIKVPANWAVSLPSEMSMKDAMVYGTAGLTAGMSVQRLIEQVKPEDGKIAVSGSTGGVGALSVAILAKLGYTVAAITGKASEEAYLKNLGASEIILREDFENLDKKPMLRTAFAGAIDTVGGVILENLIKTTQPLGAVTACGNAASIKIDLTVFPFILRGVSLLGIDSQNYPMEKRTAIWEALATTFRPDALMEVYEEVTLEQLQEKIDLILQGKLSRRAIVRIAE